MNGIKIQWKTTSKFKINRKEVENTLHCTLLIEETISSLTVNGITVPLTIYNYKFFNELLCDKALALATLDLQTEWVRNEDVIGVWDGDNTVEILEYLSPVISSPIKFVKSKYTEYNGSELISKHDVKRIGAFHLVQFIDTTIELYNKYCSYLKRIKKEDFTIKLLGSNYTVDNIKNLDLLKLAIEYYVINGEVINVDWSGNVQHQEESILAKLYAVKDEFDNVQYEVPEEFSLISQALFLYLYNKTEGVTTCEHLTTSSRLLFEGRTMNHCVGGEDHQSKVRDQKAIIFTMMDPDYNNSAYHYKATLEIEKKDNKFVINQFFTTNNEPPTKEYKSLAIKFIKELNKCESIKDLKELVSKYDFTPEIRIEKKKELNKLFTLSKVMEVTKTR